MMNGTFQTIICSFIDLLLYLLPILYMLAFLVFSLGLFKFIKNANNKDEVSKGKDYMLWGIIALFILLTSRIIVGFISQEFGFGNAYGLPLLNDGRPAESRNVCGFSGPREQVDVNIIFPAEE